jgi:hypothetical protein
MPGRRRPRRGRVTQPGNPSTADGGRGCGEGGSSGQSVGADDYVVGARAYVSAEFIGHCCFSEFVFCLLFIA